MPDRSAEALPTGHLGNARIMRSMVLGRLTTAALHAAAVLAVPDLLHQRPTGAADLAATVGADASALERLLRVMVRLGLLVEDADGVFVLADLGHTLRTDVPGSARPAALLAGAELGRCWDGVLDAVRTGAPTFPVIFGEDVFAYLDRRPALRETFFRSQHADLDLTVAELVEVFAGRRLIVDVGGSDAGLMEHVLAADPGARGIVLDLPPVAELARERLRAAGLEGRCTVQAGDFLATVPEGGDLYVLRDILHDWPDDRCVQLLKVCRRAMPPAAAMLVVERVADADAGDATVAHGLMDLYMLVALGGRERDQRDWERLAAAGGFGTVSRHRLVGGSMALVLRPTADHG